MRRALLLGTLCCAIATVPAYALDHHLAGLTNRGHPVAVTVDEHLVPIAGRIPFTLDCRPSPYPYHGAVDLSTPAFFLKDERLEDGTLHRYFDARRILGEGYYWDVAVHVSRHPDGSVHAEGWIDIVGALGHSNFGWVKCYGGARFEASEAPG